MKSPWLQQIFVDLILPRRSAMLAHPFMVEMKNGSAEKTDARHYFEGLFWHLLDFGKHVEHLIKKRPLEVTEWIAGRAEDKDGDTAILARIVDSFGGDSEKISRAPFSYAPHEVWVKHDALLRAAIYSTDLPWQVGTAALNIGIESLVPWMIEPLFEACVKKYGVSTSQAAWLESRAGEAERQHGENGFIILEKAVNVEDRALQFACRYYIDALSRSMAFGLLKSGQKSF